MKHTEKESVVIKWYKIERFFFLHKLNFIAKIIYHLIQLLFGCTIPYSTILHKGVNIAHFHGIVIHQNAVINANTVIYQNVTIAGTPDGAPIIGKNCLIGAGSVIIGNVKIGDNVKIGANAVINKNIPSNCTVVGVPGKIVKRRNLNGE